MRIWRHALLPAVVLVLGALAVSWVLLRPLPAADTAALNDLRARVVAAWPDAAKAHTGSAPRFTVLDPGGAIVFSTAPTLTSELNAASQSAHTFSLTDGDTHLGSLLVENTAGAEASARDDAALAVTTAVLAAAALAFALAVWRVDRRVLRPFRGLQSFSRSVAQGDFDTPLPMDRGNVFGAFTESFDLMRVELRRARGAEQRTREENRELLAQLGHDIRTPVAVIATAAEMLQLDETLRADAATSPKRAERLASILDRAEQVNRLVTDLIRTSEQDLVDVEMHIEPHSSAALATLIRRCDANGRIRPFTLPDCLVDYDEVRLQQIFDNVIVNAEKYAGTEILLGGDIATAGGARMLRVRLSDRGPGVKPHELDAIVGRGVRGENATRGHVPGSGLGLFIASRFMEQLGGELAVSNDDEHGGFTVSLLLPLSGGDPRERFL